MQDKYILDKAQELLDDNSQISLINPNKEIGSYEEETEFSTDRSLEYKEVLEREEAHQESFDIRQQGYQRIPKFKKPSFIKILGGLVFIIGLIILISILMPYIPPK